MDDTRLTVLLVPLTHNHSLVGALHHVEGELLICSHDLKENISGAQVRSRVSCHNCPQENYVCWTNWFEVFISLIEANPPSAISSSNQMFMLRLDNFSVGSNMQLNLMCCGRLVGGNKSQISSECAITSYRVK